MQLIQWMSLALQIRLDLKLLDDAHGTKPVNIVAASDKGHVVAGAGARAGLRKTMLDGYQWRRYCVRSSERWKCHGI